MTSGETLRGTILAAIGGGTQVEFDEECYRPNAHLSGEFIPEGVTLGQLVDVTVDQNDVVTSLELVNE